MLRTLIDHGHALRGHRLARAGAPLHCMAVSAGYEQRQDEVYSWDGLRRGDEPFLVLQHTIAGEGRLDFAGVRYRLTPGETMILALPHTHRYWLERGTRWEFFWMVLNGREALRLGQAVIEAAGPVVTLPAEMVDRLAAACLTLIDRAALQPGEASAAAYAGLAALHDGVFAGRSASPALPPPLARAAAHVEAHLAAPLTVARLAAVAGFSRAHFVRRFTAAFGVSPARYVHDRRLDRAERLLLATDMTLAAIAARAGFATPNYLAKAFRRRNKTSPIAFRRKAKSRTSL